MSAAGVEARHTHRGHHRFGAAHMEGHLVHGREGLQPGDVLAHDRMQRSKYRTEILNAVPPLLYPLLVAIEAGDIDAVGTADVDRPIPIEIPQPGALRCRHDRAEVELLADDSTEGKRHPAGVGEAKIREALADRSAPGDGLGVLLLKRRSQPCQCLPAPLHPRLAGSVGSQDLVFRIVARLHPVRYASRDRRHQRSGGQRQQNLQQPSAGTDGAHSNADNKSR